MRAFLIPVLLIPMAFAIFEVGGALFSGKPDFPQRDRVVSEMETYLSRKYDAATACHLKDRYISDWDAFWRGVSGKIVPRDNMRFWFYLECRQPEPGYHFHWVGRLKRFGSDMTNTVLSASAGQRHAVLLNPVDQNARVASPPRREVFFEDPIAMNIKFMPTVINQNTVLAAFDGS